MQVPPILSVSAVGKTFDTTPLAAVDNISFDLEEGNILGLLGPSGCGKTTLLRMIAGFEKLTTGSIQLAGQIVAGGNRFLPPELRDTGMVFQDYALFPHLNVADNIAFGLQHRRVRLDKSQIKSRIAEVLSLVGLTGLERRYPHELSGGQQQRIALARALAPQPALILLDEPLSNLDVQVRQHLRHEIRHILKATGTTAIFVTHDQEEALAICDRIAVMRQGKIEQLGTPEEIYTCPASRFVAEFVTQANFLPAERQGHLWSTEIGALAVASSLSESVPMADVMVRQEDIELQWDEAGKIVVRDRQFLGREYRYCLETPLGHQIHARTSLRTQLPIGARVQVKVGDRTPQLFPMSGSAKSLSVSRSA
jgi:iron(III) transport system ATP-binding protein